MGYPLYSDADDSFQVGLSDSKYLVGKLVDFNGEKCIDLRYHSRWTGHEEFIATKKGILVSRKLFRDKVLPKLIEWCNK